MQFVRILGVFMEQALTLFPTEKQIHFFESFPPIKKSGRMSCLKKFGQIENLSDIYAGLPTHKASWPGHSTHFRGRADPKLGLTLRGKYFKVGVLNANWPPSLSLFVVALCSIIRCMNNMGQSPLGVFVRSP